jgi:hypothetical protein
VYVVYEQDALDLRSGVEPSFSLLVANEDFEHRHFARQVRACPADVFETYNQVVYAHCQNGAFLECLCQPRGATSS